MGDRVAPVAPEIAVADLDARRRLPPLVFGQMQQPLDARDQRRIDSLRGQLARGALMLHQPDQDPVEQVIVRQAVLVLLVGAQLS